MKKKTFKTLKFSKQDVADLTKEEQKRLMGGNAPTFIDPEHGGDCTFTCDRYLTFGNVDACTYACTGDCPSRHGGGACDDASNLENATCYISAAEMCHTQGPIEGGCTDTQCTQGCPHSYGDATCGC